MKIGYRGWVISTINGEPTLRSPNSKYFWIPGENTALDSDGSIADVNEKNSCGFYALKSPESVFEYFNVGRPDRVGIDIVGEVLLYGNVVEGEKGFRGEKAMVGTLLLPTIEKLDIGSVEELCTRYNTQYSVTTGHARQVLERYRNLKAKQRLAVLSGGSRRCTAGGRAIAEIRKDNFLL